MLNPGSYFERLALRYSHKRHLDGLWIGILADKKEHFLLERVEDALKLIRQHDPLRYSRILRDIERIWISIRISGGGEFSLTNGICHLDKRYIEKSSVQAIASMIVHETTHAYPCLRKMGYPEELRYRIEQICMRQELIFARRVPENKSVCECLERKMKRDPSFWSDKEIINRRPGQELAAVRAVGLPDWFIQLALKWREFRWKRFRKQR